MIRLTISIILIAHLNSWSIAQKASVELAQTVAENFYRSLEQTNSNAYIANFLTHLSNSNDTLFYIFNFSDTGFVIVSADKQIPPILAYSFESFFTGHNMPPALQGLLDEYSKLISHVRIFEEANINVEAINKWNYILEKKQLHRTQIYGPMIPCKWDQGVYYNGLCPEDPAGPGGRVYAGCVATAMAMMMYWFRHPNNGTGSNGYWSDYGWLQVNFWQSEYKWDAMPTQLLEPNYYVAKLIYDAGVSVNMMYSPNGSGAYMEDAANALITYFKYNPNLSLEYRDNYSLNSWKNLLKQQLNQNYPIIYAGYGSYGPGHAFICDGYDSNDLFHFNWGWSGHYNGFYLMDYLTPGGYNFSSWQMAIINCFPIDETHPQYCQGFKELNYISGSFTDGSEHLDYKNNTSCSWLIRPSVPVKYINLFFHKFSTEANADYLCIYDGSDQSATLLGCYSGNTLPPQISTQNNSIFVTFQSNESITNKGFFAEYVAKPVRFCSGLVKIEEPTGIIEDGSGQFLYQPNSICRWWIKPPNTHNITINFTRFQTESNKDFVIFLDPSTYPSTELIRFSGNQIPPQYTFFGSSLVVLFKTDSYNEYDGWEIHYVTNVASADENNNIFTQISPILTQDILNIYTSHSSLQYYILSTCGKILLCGNITQPNTTISVASLHPGTYIIVLKDESNLQIKHQLFIKM